ncbi:poly [ADP-ribose] polymerase tankyrase-2-like [Ruditapes philippinarum]|uniref:poly [ADP-ribose] polymerase tankyrase-2-like n=1 Tax=Ruditapes philippinarum TaxID=129788 RepID=UPI00295A9D67|nr:poly [ADP-ribose] polymerase tankyrase-2-like [Ruditapes philippinarum]
MHGSMAITLLEAIKNGDQDTAKRILLQKRYTYLDRQSSKKDGTALFWSCCRGYLDIVHLLLLHGADVNTCTAWGAAPLHASADHNHVEILILLLKYGADVNQQTTNGDTPCHLASYRGYAECVQRLAERGANVEIRNNKRHTPIQESYMQGHYEIYRYLLSVQKLVNNNQPSLSATKIKPYPNELKKYTPSPVPGDYYGWHSVQSTTSGSENRLSSSIPNDCFSSSNTNSSSIEHISSPSGNRTRNSVIGVLRLREYNTEDSQSDSSSVNDDSMFLNDLSSVQQSDISPPKVPERKCLSFKNI